MAKKKKSSSGAGKGKAKSGSAKSGSSKGAGKAVKVDLSRKDFLKMAGVTAIGLGTAAVGLGGVAKAQIPPECQLPEPVIPNFDAEHTFKTLAAVADTTIPGVLEQSIPVFGVNELGEIVPLPVSPMENLGAEGEVTPGASFIPPNGDDFVPPPYPFVYLFLPVLTYEPNIINQLVYFLDDSSKIVLQNPGALFKDLLYDERFFVFYYMDKLDYFIAFRLVPYFAQLLAQQGCPPQIIEQLAPQYAQGFAVAAKQLLTLALSFTYTFYFSELCNVIPEDENGQSVYRRTKEDTWSIIPYGAWDQMGYPGPSDKEPSYTSDYEGLKVTIADGKVKFVQ